MLAVGNNVILASSLSYPNFSVALLIYSAAAMAKRSIREEVNGGDVNMRWCADYNVGCLYSAALSTTILDGEQMNILQLPLLPCVAPSAIAIGG